MFNVNDIVVCGNNGICRIETIEKKSIMNQAKQFYVMVPVVTHDATLKTKIMLATDTLKPMRYLKTKEEVIADLAALSKSEYYDEKDYKKREKYYKEVINSIDVFSYPSILKTIYSDNVFSSSTDQLYIEVIKRICNEEIGYVLSIEDNEVERYISKYIN